MHWLSVIAQIWHDTPGPVKTVITAALGTLIGAWLTSRSQQKRRVVEELRALRSAYSLCFSIINRALGLKRQLIRPMEERYEEAVRMFHLHQKRRQGLLQLSLDLQTLSQVKFPSELVEKIVFEKCVVNSKGLASVISLSGATDDLRNSIDLRNDLVTDLKSTLAR